MLALIRFRRPYAPRRDFDKVKSSEFGRAWKYINKHFFEQSSWRSIQAGPDGQWEEVHTIVNREEGSEKIEAEEHLAGLFANFRDLPQPKGSRTTQSWLDDDEAQRVALSKFCEGMRQRHRSTLIRLGFEEADICLDLKALSVNTSPEHIRAIRAQRDGIISQIARKKAEKALKRQKGKGAAQTQ
jgi:hypothetical protein